MNIGEKFYCSSCLAELSDEKICPFCGYSPSKIPETDVLEEGTLLNGLQYQLGAVNSRTKNSIIYGAFDYIRQQTTFITEYYPADLAARDVSTGDKVMVLSKNLADFQSGKKDFLSAITKPCEIFQENGTVYLARLHLPGPNL